jgi:NADPH:quinone reductase-like Zn-dependent oxidoreductase
VSTDPPARPDPIAPTMRAVRLQQPGGLDALTVEEIETPRPGFGEALVRVHAAAITRDELGWPVERLPATPSYELSGIVVEVGPGVAGVANGEAVYALTDFDRDGVAAEYAAVPAGFLAPKPRSLGHVESAALPLAGLSAWQGLFVHGGLQASERVLIHGAAGGVGHIAVQLARWRGAHVIGTTSGAGVETVRAFGAHEVVDRTTATFEDAAKPVDLVFDTAGGEALARSAAVLKDGGRLVSVAEEPPADVAARVATTYFIVEPDRDQLVELARLADEETLRPAIDSVFQLADARAAFERVMGSGKRGKVVLEVVHD